MTDLDIFRVEEPEAYKTVIHIKIDIITLSLSDNIVYVERKW